MKTKVSIAFYCKLSKEKTDGTSPIEMTITLNGNDRVSYMTGLTLSPKKWDIDKQKSKGNNQETTYINKSLEEYKYNVLNIVSTLDLRDELFTAKDVREYLKGNNQINRKFTILTVYDEYLKEEELIVGKSLCADTHWTMCYSRRLLSEFIINKIHKKDIRIDKLNIEFLTRYNTWLIGEKNQKQNTAIKYIKALQRIVNISIQRGYLSNNPFLGWKNPKITVNIEYLNEEELRKVELLDIPIARIMKAKDFFLLSCYTGLAYIDIKTLKASNIISDDKGREWILKKRQKTNVLSRIPLLPQAKSIIYKYQNSTNNQFLSIQDNGDINKYVKDIAALCGINKYLTFHSARHTFASTVSLSKGISMEVVSKMMGHTNTRMTQHYAKLADELIFNQMDNVYNLEIKNNVLCK